MNNYFNNYDFMKNLKQNKNISFQQKANNYNKQYKSNLNNTPSLFNPYQGFIRGNMFEGLYDSYKIKEPYDIKPMNEQAELFSEYLNKFGPLLLNSDSLNTYPWAWDDRPWPWEA